MVGPAGLSPRAALAGLFDGEGPAGIIVRDIRLPRTLLALLIGATLGLSGAALQGLLRNPLAEPALFGAPQAAARGASFVIAFGLAAATSFAVPFAGIAGALVSIGGLVAIAGRRASLTVTLLAGLALASFAGAATALILNLAPNPFIALEVAFWLLGSLEDRSRDHLIIAAPFFLASWVLLALNARAFRALTLGEDAAASLGVDLTRTRMMVVIGVALGVGAAVAVAGSIGFVGLVAPHLVRRAVGSDPARVLPAGRADRAPRCSPPPTSRCASFRSSERVQGRRRHGADRRAVLPRHDLSPSGACWKERRRERRDPRGRRRQRAPRRHRHRRAREPRAQPRRMVALVGPNGAGKTTLMRALAGLLPAEGRNRARWPPAGGAPRERARRIAYLPQGTRSTGRCRSPNVVALGRYPHADPFSTPHARPTARRSRVRSPRPPRRRSRSAP